MMLASTNKSAGQPVAHNVMFIITNEIHSWKIDELGVQSSYNVTNIWDELCYLAKLYFGTWCPCTIFGGHSHPQLWSWLMLNEQWIQMSKTLLLQFKYKINWLLLILSRYYFWFYDVFDLLIIFRDVAKSILKWNKVCRNASTGIVTNWLVGSRD